MVPKIALFYFQQINFLGPHISLAPQRKGFVINVLCLDMKCMYNCKDQMTWAQMFKKV